MSTRAAAAFLVAMLLPCAFAATTTTVVDVPAANGTQRFLHVRPDAPRATIVAIPGGDGILGIQNDGTMTTFTALCSPIVRNREAFAARGFSLALVDATSTGSVYDFNDLREVVRYVRGRDNVPTWVTGGSSSTAGTVNLAVNLSAAEPVGVALFSPGTVSAPLAAALRRPTLVISNSLDTNQSSAAVYNSLVNAPVKQRIVLTGGSSGGCSYHLFQGLDAEFVAAVGGFIDAHNASFAAPANYQGLWWKSPASSESGWGVNITHQGDILFATWFTYDADSSGLWLVMSNGAKTGEGTYSGALYRTTGPAFDTSPWNPMQVTATQVGTASFAFADASNGTFTYTVNGATQSKSITRQVFSSPIPTCVQAQTFAPSSNYSDLWWRAPGGSESGWGVNITHQGDILFATWFTYEAGGKGLWLVMSNGAKTGPGTYSGALYRTTGPVFNAIAWNPSQVGVTQVGTGTFSFSDASSGTFAYTVNGISQTKAITRQVYATPATVCN